MAYPVSQEYPANLARPARARWARGFSLLEVLVTMVVVALIVTLLMQGLSQALNIRARLLHHQQQATLASLQERWFRDTVGSALADLPDAFGVMAGTRDSMAFATAGPLVGSGPQRVTWSLQPVPGGWSLKYSDPANGDMVVIKGPLAEASFAYLGTDSSQWSDRWDPEYDQNPGADNDDVQVLPRMVRLQAQGANGTLYWLVPIQVDAAMPRFLRPEDVLDGLL
ncbi:MAG: PulJ/GspJ family protein [Thermomonas sp.]